VILYFIVILLVSLVLTGLIRQYALSNKVLDVPNERSSHTVPTPRGGGLAIVLAFVVAIGLIFFRSPGHANLLVALSSTLFVAVIGFCDDHAHVPARWRILVHVFAALMALFFLCGLPNLLLPAPIDWLFKRWIVDLGWLGYLVGTLMLVWFLNLFNFMDGTDGIAASEAIFVSGGLAAYLYYLDSLSFSISISVMAASMGFLLWNWPKAKIFMGDVGSGFLGLLLGILILLATQQAAVLFYCGLILFGIFLVDSTYTLLYRFFSGQKWYDAHCSHTYQRAAKKYGHLTVLLSCWAINLFWLLPVSLLVFLHPHYALLGMLLAYFPLILLAYYFKAGQAA